MAKMTAVPYPEWEDVLIFTWEAGFKFPQGFKQELMTRFPDWAALKEALDRDDEDCTWALLHTYQERLSEFPASEILKATSLAEVQERAKMTKDFGEFLEKLEERHFPEKIKRREEDQKRIRQSWKFQGY